MEIYVYLREDMRKTFASVCVIYIVFIALVIENIIVWVRGNQGFVSEDLLCVFDSYFQSLPDYT